MVHLEDKEEWFATWFDSPYYHVLYDHRNDEEAADFLQKLVEYLSIPKNSKVLDLCCGAGRHSRVLQRLGLEVSGCDLSANSIQEAKLNSAPEIVFFEHDMRDSLSEKYAVIFNLFTSFGYFDDLSDNLKVLNAVNEALNPGGLFVLDFMNVHKVEAELKRRQEIQKGTIRFFIQREISAGKVVKSIAFEDAGKSYFFQEKVQALTLDNFRELFEKSGLKIREIFGNYQLEGFNPVESDRLIFVCEKL